jgi:hypothetical protein
MISRNFHQIRFKTLFFSIFIIMTILSTLPMANADDGDIEKSGKCSKGSKWKLSLSPDNAMIEVDFEAENTSLVKQDWKIIIKNNKKTVFQKTIPAGTSFGDDSDDNDDNDEEDDLDDEDDDTVYVFDISTDIVNRKGMDRVVVGCMLFIQSIVPNKVLHREVLDYRTNYVPCKYETIAHNQIIMRDTATSYFRHEVVLIQDLNRHQILP